MRIVRCQAAWREQEAVVCCPCDRADFDKRNCRSCDVKPSISQEDDYATCASARWLGGFDRGIPKDRSNDGHKRAFCQQRRSTRFKEADNLFHRVERKLPVGCLGHVGAGRGVDLLLSLKVVTLHPDPMPEMVFMLTCPRRRHNERRIAVLEN